MKSEQQQMIAEIENEVRYTRDMTGMDRLDPRVMGAMRDVPRDMFVPAAMRAAAFDNGPLPIGHGQTISQPYIVALMTALLQIEPDHHVLEIGTGSGYQTAILSRLAAEVYTVEIVAELADGASQRFDELGYDNIKARIGNGYHGWSDHAPYEGIIVTAAAPHIPMSLLDQLKSGGRMVVPVGQPHGHQELMLVEKNRQGEPGIRSVLGVAFVPLVDR